ncbi:hypothetical protein AB0G66_21390 [Streptomyces lydicus]
MILRALASPLPVTWVTGDCAYRQEWRMRRTLEEAGVDYVLAVPKSQQMHTPFGRIDQAIADVPGEAWQRQSCGNDAKGPRLYHWARHPPAGDRGLRRRQAASRPPRTNVASTSTKSAAIQAGTDTSPWPCSPTLSWPPSQPGQPKGAAETTPPAPSASPWQKSADSWILCCPAPLPASDRSPTH